MNSNNLLLVLLALCASATCISLGLKRNVTLTDTDIVFEGATYPFSPYGVSIGPSGDYVVTEIYSTMSSFTIRDFNANGTLAWRVTLTASNSYGFTAIYLPRIFARSTGIFLCGQATNDSFMLPMIAKISWSGYIEWQHISEPSLEKTYSDLYFAFGSYAIHYAVYHILCHSCNSGVTYVGSVTFNGEQAGSSVEILDNDYTTTQITEVGSNLVISGYVANHSNSITTFDGFAAVFA